MVIATTSFTCRQQRRESEIVRGCRRVWLLGGLKGTQVILSRGCRPVSFYQPPTRNITCSMALGCCFTTSDKNKLSHEVSTCPPVKSLASSIISVKGKLRKPYISFSPIFVFFLIWFFKIVYMTTWFGRRSPSSGQDAQFLSTSTLLLFTSVPLTLANVYIGWRCCLFV
jgi:hypothetical protein